jgi:outer membrane lipopolysaccharide assembly protein LptE/RlpB
MNDKIRTLIISAMAGILLSCAWHIGDIAKELKELNTILKSWEIRIEQMNKP